MEERAPGVGKKKAAAPCFRSFSACCGGNGPSEVVRTGRAAPAQSVVLFLFRNRSPQNGGCPFRFPANTAKKVLATKRTDQHVGGDKNGGKVFATFPLEGICRGAGASFLGISLGDFRRYN